MTEEIIGASQRSFELAGRHGYFCLVAPDSTGAITKASRRGHKAGAGRSVPGNYYVVVDSRTLPPSCTTPAKMWDGEGEGGGVLTVAVVVLPVKYEPHR